MTTPLHMKSPVEAIRERFDKDVDRFADLERGQAATMDAPLAMSLITAAAVRSTPTIRRVLDIGCGAGNNTIKLLHQSPGFDCDLVDLSMPMLERARKRITAEDAGRITLFHGDIRDITLPDNRYDVILAAAVLHHLRGDDDWLRSFEKLYRITAPGGSVWISDLVAQETEPVQILMWARYGEYLSAQGGDGYRDRVLACIDQEDSPRSVVYQMDLLRRVGFGRVELLHKNACFAAFGAIKD